MDATLHGLKGQTQFFSFTGIPLNSSPEHRPVTKAQLFKPTLYKSYCEGSFACEPNDIIGPQRNRVLTIGAVCGKSLHAGAGGGGINSLAGRYFWDLLRLRRHIVVALT